MRQPEILHTLTNFTLGCDFLLGIFLGVAGIAAYSWKRRRRTGHGDTVATALTQERKRIARDLHDSVGHGLLVIAMNARQLPAISTQARPVAQAIDDAVQRTIGDIRHVIGGLRGELPAIGGEADECLLSTRLRQLCNRFSDSDVSLSLVNTELETLVSLPLRHTIFRVVQECLTNALKHGSDPVRILLKFDDDITLCVANGACAGELELLSRQPLGQSRTHAGNGLHGLCERVSEMNGSIEYGTPPRGGFVVRARIPMADSEKETEISHGWDRRPYRRRSAAG